MIDALALCTNSQHPKLSVFKPKNVIVAGGRLSRDNEVWRNGFASLPWLDTIGLANLLRTADNSPLDIAN